MLVIFSEDYDLLKKIDDQIVLFQPLFLLLEVVELNILRAAQISAHNPSLTKVVLV